MSLLCRPGGSTAELLDEAENELSSHRLRCVRVYGPSSGGLSLRDLVAQIVDRADPDALTDHDLKAGFVTLTEPGDGYDRVALLVTEAHNLTPSALHYIQLACRSSPKLRVALAGQPNLAVILARDEFADLRQRITRTLKLPGAAPAGLRWGSSWSPIRLGAVAMAALVIGVAGWRHGPAPSEAAVPGMSAASTPVTRPETAGPAATQANQPSAEAAPPRMADAPGTAEPAVAQQGEAASAGMQAAALLPELAAANASMSGQADAPLAEPTRSDAPPVATLLDTVLPDAVPPDAVPPLGALAVTSVPVPPPRVSAFALPPSGVLPARRLRGGAERAAASMAAVPIRPTDGRRCRDIVLHAQSGKDLSNADQTFLRDDCRAK